MLRYLVGLALIAHGVAHALFLLDSQSERVDSIDGSSWLLGGYLLIGARLHALLGLLWIWPMAGFLLAASGYLGQTGWWGEVALVSAAVSALMVVACWGGIAASAAISVLVVDVIVVGVLLWEGLV